MNAEVQKLLAAERKRQREIAEVKALIAITKAPQQLKMLEEALQSLRSDVK